MYGVNPGNQLGASIVVDFVDLTKTNNPETKFVSLGVNGTFSDMKWLDTATQGCCLSSILHMCTNSCRCVHEDRF